MRTGIIFLGVLAACVGIFFLPHHRRKTDSFKPVTLAGIYLDLWKDMPRRLKPEMRVMLLLAVTGLISSFYPAAMVLMLRFVPHEPIEVGGVWFVLGGIVSLVGVGANFLAMLINYVSFGWGASSPTNKQTPGFYIVLIYQIFFAALSIAIGVSGDFARLLNNVAG